MQAASLKKGKSAGVDKTPEDLVQAASLKKGKSAGVDKTPAERI